MSKHSSFSFKTTAAAESAYSVKGLVSKHSSFSFNTAAAAESAYLLPLESQLQSQSLTQSQSQSQSQSQPEELLSLQAQLQLPPSSAITTATSLLLWDSDFTPVTATSVEIEAIGAGHVSSLCALDALPAIDLQAVLKEEVHLPRSV
jgi:hypothetical protein